MKKDTRHVVQMVSLAVFSLIFSAVSARAQSLPDPLKLRAECAAPRPAAEATELVLETPEKIAAEAQEFLRRGIAATVVIEIARCDRPDCAGTKANGTGTVVSADGLVLTAYHVIDDSVAIKAVFRTVDADGFLVVTGRTTPAKVVAFSRERDVALLKLEPDGQPFPHMPIECRWQPDRRSPVWHFGQRTGWAFGRVTYKTTSSVGIEGVFETDAKARPGDSGAPFVRSTGSLIGILLSINGGGKTFYMPAADAINALEKGDVAK